MLIFSTNKEQRKHSIYFIFKMYYIKKLYYVQKRYFDVALCMCIHLGQDYRFSLFKQHF